MYDARGQVPIAASITVDGNRYDVISPEGTSPEAWLGEVTWILDPVDIIDISETLLQNRGGTQRKQSFAEDIHGKRLSYDNQIGDNGLSARVVKVR